MNRIFTLSYLLILVFHVYATEAGLELVERLSKPALLSSLIIFTGLNARKYGFSLFAKLILAAMVLSLLGDVLLIFQEGNSDYFIYGLAAFFFAQIAYTLAFARTYLENHEIPLLKKHGWALVLVAAYGYLFFNQIKAGAGQMGVAVLIYMIAILLMLLFALNRMHKVSPRSFRLIAAGAVLFVVSDSLIAWNKFVQNFDYSDFAIMGTYGLAQLGIGMGAVEQIRDNRFRS